MGGAVTSIVRNAPLGLGEPVFNKFHAYLSQAVMSINACRAFEVGAGQAAARMTGEENNDQMFFRHEKVGHYTNNAGGVLGGITTGEDIIFTSYFKPTPSICREQNTIDAYNNNVSVKIKGRHDPCVVLRAVPVVEAMTAMSVLDFIMLDKSKDFFWER